MTTITMISDSERERMRRSVAGRDQGPSQEQQDGGTYPFIGALRAGLSDPQDPTNVSFPFLRRMRRDHMVAMGLHFIDMGVVGAPWYIAGNDARVQTYADKLIRPIYGDLVLTILRFLWAGYSPAARNFDFVKPDWTYYDGGEAKKVWDNGAVDAIIYKSITPLRPESSRPIYQNGSFAGIQYDEAYSSGAFIIDGSQTPNVDLMHSIWAVHDRVGSDGSPYGFPRIAHCAPIFWMFRYLWDLIGRAFENSADPGPVVRYPHNDSPTLGSDGTQVKARATAIKLGQRRRTGSTIALPSDVWMDMQEKPTSVKKWDIEYPKGATDFDAMMKFLGYLEAGKLRSLWLPEQGLIEGAGGQSSRNVASEFGDQRDASQKVLIKTIDQIIIEVMVKPVISMVFPFYTGELEKVTLGMGDDESDLIRQAFQLAGQGNFQRFGIDLRRLAEMHGFPMLDPAEQKRLMDEARQQANQAQPPVVNPTQGRRAKVTQTGFGEFSYHQLGDELPLVDVALEATDDGDFVASLPRTDAFADPVVVKEARKLRAAAQSHLAWAYRDFMLYLSKQRFAGDLLSGDGTAPEETAARLVRAWIPARRAQSWSDRLGAVAARVGRNHRVSLDDRAERFTDDVVEVETRVMLAARERLAREVTTGLAAGDGVEVVARTLVESVERWAKDQAAELARDEVAKAYNLALIDVGHRVGVVKMQVVDPSSSSNGMIIDLGDDAWIAEGRSDIRLLPRATRGLTIRREVLADGVQAKYDVESETVLVSVDLAAEDETKYMLELGEVLAKPALADA